METGPSGMIDKARKGVNHGGNEEDFGSCWAYPCHLPGPLVDLSFVVDALARLGGEVRRPSTS